MKIDLLRIFSPRFRRSRLSPENSAPNRACPDPTKRLMCPFIVWRKIILFSLFCVRANICLLVASGKRWTEVFWPRVAWSRRFPTWRWAKRTAASHYTPRRRGPCHGPPIGEHRLTHNVSHVASCPHSPFRLICMFLCVMNLFAKSKVENLAAKVVSFSVLQAASWSFFEFIK